MYLADCSYSRCSVVVVVVVVVVVIAVVVVVVVVVVVCVCVCVCVCVFFLLFFFACCSSSPSFLSSSCISQIENKTKKLISRWKEINDMALRATGKSVEEVEKEKQKFGYFDQVGLIISNDASVNPVHLSSTLNDALAQDMYVFFFLGISFSSYH